ncbi:MAG: hypothetical protein ACK550_05415 [Synechococcaceae cyanobacterium]
MVASDWTGLVPQRAIEAAQVVNAGMAEVVPLDSLRLSSLERHLTTTRPW